jgi:hypothetical protein
MHESQRRSRMLSAGAVCVLLGGAMLQSGLAAAQTPARDAEPFGQETVETRPSRTPQPASQRPHRHVHGAAHDHSGHDHAPHGHAGHGASSDNRHASTSHKHSDGHRHGAGDQHGHDHGIETENMFGFTLGSDTEEAGAKGVAVETVARFGKRDGRYSAVGTKLEFAYGITDDVSTAIGLFGSRHNISGVTGFDDVHGGGFNGLGGELRWRLIRRTPSSFGVTLHLEPSWQTHDELTGLGGTKYGSENKLIIDKELVHDRVFAAFNLLYEFERMRESGSDEWEKGSKVGFGMALSAAVAPKIFIGGEARYLRAYEGVLPETFVGDAWYVGPTLFAHFAPNAWISAAWNVQVAGHEVGVDQRLDLTNFERHQVRLKVGVEF